MIYLVLSVTAALLLAAVYHFGKSVAQKETANEHAEAIKEVAQEFANTPITGDDFHKRLRARIANKH